MLLGFSLARVLEYFSGIWHPIPCCGVNYHLRIMPSVNISVIFNVLPNAVASIHYHCILQYLGSENTSIMLLVIHFFRSDWWVAIQTAMMTEGQERRNGSHGKWRFLISYINKDILKQLKPKSVWPQDWIHPSIEMRVLSVSHWMGLWGKLTFQSDKLGRASSH